MLWKPHISFQFTDQWNWSIPESLGSWVVLVLSWNEFSTFASEKKRKNWTIPKQNVKTQRVSIYSRSLPVLYSTAREFQDFYILNQSSGSLSNSTVNRKAQRPKTTHFSNFAHDPRKSTTTGFRVRIQSESNQKTKSKKSTCVSKAGIQTETATSQDHSNSQHSITKCVIYVYRIYKFPKKKTYPQNEARPFYYHSYDKLSQNSIQHHNKSYLSLWNGFTLSPD